MRRRTPSTCMLCHRPHTLPLGVRASRSKPTTAASPDRRRATPSASSLLTAASLPGKRGYYLAATNGGPRICAPAADGGRDKAAPEGRRRRRPIPSPRRLPPRRGTAQRGSSSGDDASVLRLGWDNAALHKAGAPETAVHGLGCKHGGRDGSRARPGFTRTASIAAVTKDARRGRRRPRPNLPPPLLPLHLFCLLYRHVVNLHVQLLRLGGLPLPWQLPRLPLASQ